MKLNSLVIGMVLMVWPLYGCQTTQYVPVGPNWVEMQSLEPGSRSFPVEVRGKDEYRTGETIHYSVRSSRAGRLWLVQVDASDEVSLLYPNRYEEKTSIIADTWVEIPPQGAGWSFKADEPIGLSLVTFIVTPGDANLTEFLEAHPGQGEMSISPQAISRVAAENGWGIAKHVLKVVWK